MSNEIKKKLTYICYTTKNNSHSINSLLRIFLYLYQVIHIDYANRYHMHTQKIRRKEH